MTTQSWPMYWVLVIIATSTPGPAVLFIVTNSTLHGWEPLGMSLVVPLRFTRSQRYGVIKKLSRIYLTIS
jgi:hypothetical protein